MIVSWAEWCAVSSFGLAVKQARHTLFRLLSSSQIKSFEQNGYFDDKTDKLGTIRFHYGHSYNMQSGRTLWNSQSYIQNKDGDIPFVCTIPVEDHLTTQVVMARCRPAMLTKNMERFESKEMPRIPFQIYTGLKGSHRFIMGHFDRDAQVVEVNWL